MKRTFLVVSLLGLVMGAGPSANAQNPCVEFGADFWSGTCLVDPQAMYQKAHSAQRFAWDGVPFLAVDMGDEVMFYSLELADMPVELGRTSFHMGTVGDAEYLLYQFSVTDDTHFLFGVHRTGVVMADLGSGERPLISDERTWRIATSTSGPSEVDFTDNNLGGMVFNHEGRTFVLTHVFKDSCVDVASLYEVTRGSQIDLGLVGCVPYPAGIQAIGVQGGRMVGDYLYVAFNLATSAQVRENVAVYQVSGAGPELTPVATRVFNGNLLRASSFDLDIDHQLIASADFGAKEVSLWSAGYMGVGSWAEPVLLRTIPVPPIRDVSPGVRGPRSVALSWPLLWVDGAGLMRFDVGPRPDILVPRQVASEVGFFHSSAPGAQNDEFTECLDWNTVTGVFDPSGDFLYLPRFAVSQVYNTSDCRSQAVVAPGLGADD